MADGSTESFVVEGTEEGL